MTGVELQQSLPAITRKANFEARRLIACGWFRPEEHEDLQQELLCHWWRKGKAIPTSAGAGSAYGAAVLRNKGLDLARHEHGSVRDPRKSCPLPGENAGDDRQPNLPRALISDPQYGLDIDVRRVIDQLSPAKQKFAWLLAEGSLQAAGEAVGISRATASRWKVEIRELFLRYGVGPAGAR